MQIHELEVVKKKPNKRVGRGGCRGTYSGRGMNGQKSRSGASIDPLFEGGRSSLVKRMKKIRGFKSIHPKMNIISLNILEKLFSDGDKVSLISVADRGIVRNKDMVKGIKIVGNGKLSKKLFISKEIRLTKKAKSEIEKLGGEIES